MSKLVKKSLLPYTTVYAFSLDCLRICFSLIAFSYFLNCILEAHLFSSPEGLIDHSLLLEYIWPAKIGIFSSATSESFVYYIYQSALFLSVLMLLGIKPQLCALGLYIITVSTYRWNLSTFHIEDMFMHLALFWLIFLPTGMTLKLNLQRKSLSSDMWLNLKVSSATVTCFKLNILFVWFLAGILKFKSQMWLDGFALYPTLKSAVSRFPDIWTANDLLYLKPLTYAALITEPLIPLMLLSRHSAIKLLGLFCMINLHLGVAVLTTVPIANLVMLSSAWLFFDKEIASFIKSKIHAEADDIIKRQGPYWSVIPAFAVLLIIISGLKFFKFAISLPLIKPLISYSLILLWGMGLAQGYSFFDWIDNHNFHLQNEIKILNKDHEETDIDPKTFFTASSRSKFLLAPILGGQWVFQPAGKAKLTHYGLVTFKRYIKHFCDSQENRGRFRVYNTTTVITPENLDERYKERRLLSIFSCNGHSHPEIDIINFYRPPEISKDNLAVPEIIFRNGKLKPWAVIDEYKTILINKKSIDSAILPKTGVLAAVELTSESTTAWDAEIIQDNKTLTNLHFNPKKTINDFYTYARLSPEKKLELKFSNTAPDDAALKFYIGLTE